MPKSVLLMTLAVRAVAAALAVVLAVVLAACGTISAPPRPAASRVPTLIARVSGQLDDGRYRLADGTVFDLGDLGSAPRASGVWLSVYGTQPVQGGLVLAGTDAIGPFWAGTLAQRDGCYELHGRGYLEPGIVHLSSGLVVSIAADVTVRRDRSPDQLDPSWVMDYDRVCLDERGVVRSIWQLPLGA